MSSILQVVTTTSSSAEANSIATALVEERLAACVQISGPITSVYRWQGVVEQSEEWRLIIKCPEDHLTAVMERIAALHSYDVPQIVAWPIPVASPAYARWVSEATRTPPADLGDL